MAHNDVNCPSCSADVWPIQELDDSGRLIRSCPKCRAPFPVEAVSERSEQLSECEQKDRGELENAREAAPAGFGPVGPEEIAYLVSTLTGAKSQIATLERRISRALALIQ